MGSADGALGRLERLVNWRTTRFHLPYGDQGLFMTRETFRRIGGFSEQPVLEDLDIVRKLHNWGRRLAYPDAAASTSARRWQRLGALRLTLMNQLSLCSYFLGVPPSQVARWYRPGLRRGQRRLDTEEEPSLP
jgi:hypothetical protein